MSDEKDFEDTNPTWACFVCRCPATYQMRKVIEEISGYLEDEDGNLQMNLEEKTDIVWVCNEHSNKYLNRGYNITFSKNIREQQIINEYGVSYKDIGIGE